MNRGVTCEARAGNTPIHFTKQVINVNHFPPLKLKDQQNRRTIEHHADHHHQHLSLPGLDKQILGAQPDGPGAAAHG